jgi:hypothetical protein
LKKWLVVIDHFGHDIMPGELTYQLRWKAEP